MARTRVRVGDVVLAGTAAIVGSVRRVVPIKSLRGFVSGEVTGDEDSGARFDDAPSAAANIVSSGIGAPGESLERREGSGTLIDAARILPELARAADVKRVNTLAGGVATARSADLGPEDSGVTGFYGVRAREESLLRPSEILCAAFVEQKMAGVRGVYEIGCGLGVLTTLLAMRGVRAVGVERIGARLATAESIAAVVLERSPGGSRRPRFVKGVFPDVLRKDTKLAASVALVTNLLGTATTEQQEGFVGGLRAFGAVLIDVERFYERRSTRDRIEELEAMFTLAGFDLPRLAFDLGSGGRFMLFTNPKPRRRLGLQALLATLGAVRDVPVSVTA